MIIDRIRGPNALSSIYPIIITISINVKVSFEKYILIVIVKCNNEEHGE